MPRQARERGTGRYTFDGDMDRLCTCGHPLGWHTAERAKNHATSKTEQPCLASDEHAHDGPAEACACACFKPAKAAR